MVSVCALRSYLRSSNIVRSQFIGRDSIHHSRIWTFAVIFGPYQCCIRFLDSLALIYSLMYSCIDDVIVASESFEHHIHLLKIVF